jgi:glycogen operon protein
MSATLSATVSSGSCAPLGATLAEGGANFSLYSRHAAAIELLLFNHPDDARPTRIIPIHPQDRTCHYWHKFVPAIEPGQIYAYRVHGPFDPAAGLRFDPTKLLLDPYARAVMVPSGYNREAARRPGDNAASAMKSVVVDPSDYDWQDDAPPRLPSARTIIYEMHVRGFTQHPTSELSDSLRGTYAGIILKIPYLKRLGITAVELLPVFQFDAQDSPPGTVNYWGYQPVSFFAPHQAYSSRRDPLGPVNEFRDMVKALHRAGIEVILDVVFNHTSEGPADGPTISLRGVDNPTYYMLQQDRAQYLDYSGCGNTLNANHPIVRMLILDSLRYWVRHMHVDGFRFDLASILARDVNGHVLPNPPLLWDIDSDPVLSGTKLIAEAWDAAGLYQVGSFIGDNWKEWNGRFRDDVRAFWRGDSGSLARFADRLVGSPQVYGHKQREPEQSVNFVTCHDGFTLNDLVSYNEKHNQANGQENRDGADDNRSWNCGAEGPTNDPGIEKLRNRQVKNFLTTTLLAIGVPMIVMGDEVRRTQLGNNNPYCQDNEVSWFDWSLLQDHAEIHRFTSLLCERRIQRTIEHESHRISLNQLIAEAEKNWHGVALGQPDWRDVSHSVSITIRLRSAAMLVHLIFNAFHKPLLFELPQAVENTPIVWQRWIDTSLDPPYDIVSWNDSPVISGRNYLAESRSVVVFFATSPVLADRPE